MCGMCYLCSAFKLVPAGSSSQESVVQIQHSLELLPGPFWPGEPLTHNTTQLSIHFQHGAYGHKLSQILYDK